MISMRKRMKDNRGFSLITVILAVAFIAILGLLVLYLALQNFRMKATDIKGKDSFYTAEQALEECDGEVKTAIVYLKTKTDKEEARRRLKNGNGIIRRALQEEL